MGLTTAFTTARSGLTSHSEMVNVAGNNIANVNTFGFKSSRIDFDTQLSQTIAQGLPPTANLGGTNPSQLGLGV